MKMKLISKTVVLKTITKNPNKCQFIEKIINLTKNPKNKKELESNLLNAFPRKHKNNVKLCLNDGYRIGIWYEDMDNNLSLTESAKKVLNNKIKIQDYLDNFILNYIVDINENAHNLFYTLLQNLNIKKSNNHIDTNVIKSSIEGINNENAKAFFGLLKETSYLEKNNKKFYLKFSSQELLKKCNLKYHNKPIKELSSKNNEYLKTLVTEIINGTINKSSEKGKSNNNQYFRQKIYYGAPGTGKSYKLDQDKKEIDTETTLRITFHPSYSYSNFVGIYKPKNENNKTVFNFIPGPLINILIKAYKESKKDHLLIIEEINRANVSEVFGDFFQLIERNWEGKSQYDISVNEDLKIYLNQEKDKEKNNKKLNNLNPDKLCFPSNLYIWATMNSSDQGTFPLDTAFKRRWDFEYIGIDDNEKEVENVHFKLSDDDEEINWNKFRKFINGKLLEIHSTINEDKLLGPFFIGGNLNENDPKYNAQIIKNKVIPYLYEDVLKYLGHEEIKKIFNKKLKTLSQIIKEFDEENAKFTDVFSFSNKEIEDSANNSNSNNNATTESQDK